MSKKIKEAVGKIKALKLELQADLAEVPNLVIRTDNVLDTMANSLLGFIGESIESTSTAFTPTPITNVLGQDVSRGEKVEEKAIEPSNADKASLKEQANTAYETFLERDSFTLLESLDDIVIRAVAKKAGMKDVTSTVPEKVTIEFIDEIKSAIVSKSEIEKTKKSGSKSK